MSDRRGAEIRRMAVQKTAPEILALCFELGLMKPPPLTLKNRKGDAVDALLELLRQVIDWLDADVTAAGDREEMGLTNATQSGSLPASNGSDNLSSDEAMDILDQILSLNPAEQKKVKAKLTELGVKVGSDPKSTVLNMSKPHAKELYAYLKEL